MVEVALKLLISKIDTELLKAVLLKILKAKDVQDANIEVVWGGIGLEVAVEASHDPLEESGVESFGKSITNIIGLGALVALVHCLTCEGKKR